MSQGVYTKQQVEGHWGFTGMGKRKGAGKYIFKRLESRVRSNMRQRLVDIGGYVSEGLGTS